MISKEKKNLIIVRLFPEEDLLKELEGVCQKHRVITAIVIGGIGMLKDVELRYFKQTCPLRQDAKPTVRKGEYSSMQFEESLELISLSGNISKQENGYNLHLHAGLAAQGKQMVGGHLGRAKVAVTAEIALLKSKIKIVRREEKTTGLLGLFFK
ncbi:MAG: DUF296 domain-containing protein [Candidatus Edwardsbacteria bacterium]